MATVPLDRMIGIKADEPVWAILTRPFIVEGDELTISANTDRELRVEVDEPVALQRMKIFIVSCTGNNMVK